MPEWGRGRERRKRRGEEDWDGGEKRILEEYAPIWQSTLQDRLIDIRVCVCLFVWLSLLELYGLGVLSPPQIRTTKDCSNISRHLSREILRKHQGVWRWYLVFPEDLGSKTTKALPTRGFAHPHSLWLAAAEVARATLFLWEFLALFLLASVFSMCFLIITRMFICVLHGKPVMID